MMQLLDLLPIIERRIPDTSRVLPDPVIPDSIPQDTAQQLANADIIGNMQQLADVLRVLSGCKVNLICRILLANAN